MTWLTTPFHYEFMSTGFAAAILVGATCAVLGCYVVLRRMAFIGDAIAHTTLPGVAIAYLYKFNLFLGALVAGLLTAAGIGYLSRREDVREDSAIGVLFTGMFALGIIIITRNRSFHDFSSLLFGDVLAVPWQDVLRIGLITLLVLATLAMFHKELELTSVDPTYATVIGLRTDWMRNILLILLACTVVTSIQVVGVILTSALLVTPAAAASLLTRNLFRMMLLAAFFAITSGIIGLYISFYAANISSGAAIVLICTAWFAIAYTVKLAQHRQT